MVTGLELRLFLRSGSESQQAPGGAVQAGHSGLLMLFSLVG